MPKIDPKNEPGSQPSKPTTGKAALWGQALGYSRANSGTKKPLPVGKGGPNLPKRVDMAKAAANRLRGAK